MECEWPGWEELSGLETFLVLCHEKLLEVKCWKTELQNAAQDSDQHWTISTIVIGLLCKLVLDIHPTCIHNIMDKVSAVFCHICAAKYIFQFLETQNAQNKSTNKLISYLS